MHFSRFSWAVIAALSLSMVPATRADTIVNATFNYVNGPGAPGGPYGILITAYDGSTTLGSGYIGKYMWTQNSKPMTDPYSLATGQALSSSNNTFYTFCIEITQDIGFNGTYDYTLTPLEAAPKPGDAYEGTGGMGSVKATLLRELWGTDISQVTDATTAAEFQVAVWKIVYASGTGSNLDFSALFVNSVSDSLNTTAQSWINALTPNSKQANLIALSNPDAQDQITVVTPLPSSVWGGGLLLGCVGAFRLRRWVGAQQTV
ncbi:MAG TPA: hypothetical protein VFC78_16260 [Tepidisphaeraceae bacterium]|nr:hypothetical protein [Tepidisphaeraceae bacterium]